MTLKAFQTEVGNFIPQMEEVETANQVCFIHTVRQTEAYSFAIHLQAMQAAMVFDNPHTPYTMEVRYCSCIHSCFIPIPLL